jgi:cation diffusion facilitator CzcD-associated flavoprotein CzcO
MMRRVAVIGAGAGGLCAAKHLLQRGMEVTVFEMGSCIGGLWVYENDNGRSPAYRSLHINSEAAITSYEDFPFPPGTPLFPPHAVVRSYLEDYARVFGVQERIRFNAPVASVEPIEGDRWRVVLADGSAEEFDAVVAAPGHQAQPSHPPFREQFTGEYLHVHDYREPEPFTGKRVLVVGIGNSAMDSAADIAGVAASVTVAARSPALIMPRMLLGVPTSRVLAKVERPWMPWPVRRWLRVLLATIVHGRMERWGLTTPTKRTHPTGHPTIMSHAAYGRVVFRPGIAAVDGRQVEFVDGRREEFDVMLAATGYEVDLPFVSPDVVPVVGRRIDLYKRIFPPGRPNLCFVGYFNVSGGANIRMMDTQCRLVAAVCAGDVTLPDEAAMRADIEREKRELRELYPERPRYELELEPVSYREQIAALEGAVTGAASR